MKLLMTMVLALVLGACASQSEKSDKPAHTPMTAAQIEKYFGKDRKPTSYTDDEVFNAMYSLIVTSTKTRMDAYRDGNFELVCNAIGSKHGTDTMVYYLAFESLRYDDSVAKRLRKEIDPFSYRNYVSMDEQRLPINLHEACIQKPKNKKAISKAMDDIIGVYSLE